MNRNKTLSATLATIGLGILILWMAGFFNAEIDPALRPPEPVDIPEEHLHTVTPAARAISESVPGTTVARNETVISSRLLARIHRIHVRAGDIVSQGQLLVELEKDDLQARVNQASDQVKAIAAQRADAEQKLARTRQLARQKVATTAEVDAAVASFDAFSARLDQAGQALREADIVLGYAEIRAPLGGRIVERLAEPGDTAVPAQPMLMLYDPVSIRVEARVRESLALDLILGQEVTVDIDALDQIVAGTIDEIVPAADRASRSFLVKATLAYNHGLMPGMFARLRIPASESSDLAIPATFVTEVGELNLVYRYEDQQIQRRYIRLGQRNDGQVVITSGLEPGDTIVDPTALP